MGIHTERNRRRHLREVENDRLRDIERAERHKREREHAAEFSDILDILDRLNIDPHRLRDFLAGLS